MKNTIKEIKEQAHDYNMRIGDKVARQLQTLVDEHNLQAEGATLSLISSAKRNKRKTITEADVKIFEDFCKHNKTILPQSSVIPKR